ncbi:hypothetical protein LG3211_1545 [Lysobacter gummosus]|nr:hypothetical protein LG3211_1545 [Lysobacter gummosus]
MRQARSHRRTVRRRRRTRAAPLAAVAPRPAGDQTPPEST